MPVENGIIVSVDSSEALMKDIKELTSKQVLVGFPSSSAFRTPISNAALGYIHEFGSPANNIPARPFLFPTINKLKDKATEILKQAADLRLEHKNGEADAALNSLGLLAVSAVKDNIVSGGDPRFAPNKPATIRQKGSDHPLISTAQLLNSITYVIRDKR